MPQRKVQTGWPAIATLITLLAGVFAGWLCVSDKPPNLFYHHHRFAFCAAGALIALCIVAELSRLKCPVCRSRAIIRLSSKEIDRWLGQKTVTENAITLGAFQAHGPARDQTRVRGLNESMTVSKRIIPVTKRRILHNYRCGDCNHLFDQEVVEEMQ